MVPSDPSATTVGVVGLGRMGSEIARRILARGYEVHVFDVRAAAIEALVSAGALPCRDATQVAERARIILSSLPGPDEVEKAMNGLVHGVRRDSVILETSTIGSAQSRELAKRFEARQAFYLDAPISGGIEGAAAGTLAIMVGGDGAVLERVWPVLECFGSRIFHAGPVGAGNAMKLVIQAIFLSQVAAFLEGIALGERAGIPVQQVLDVVRASAAHHPSIAHRYDKILAGDLTPRFEIGAALKDLRLVREWSQQIEGAATIANAAAAAYGKAAEAGYREKDLIALRSSLLQ